MRKLALIVALLCAVVALAKSVTPRDLGPPGDIAGTTVQSNTNFSIPNTTGVTGIDVANRASPQEVARGKTNLVTAAKHTTLGIDNSNGTKADDDIGIRASGGTTAGKHELNYHGIGRAALKQ